MRLAYPAELCHYPDDEIVVSFRDVSWCHTSGTDVAEALLEAEDALEVAIISYIKRGEPVPVPSAPLPGEYLVALPVNTAAKAALAMAIRASGLDHAALAERLGLPGAAVRRMVRRMLNPRQVSSVNEINSVLRILGSQTVLEVQEITLEPESGGPESGGPESGELPEVASSVEALA